jgi:hypothetical protein
MICSLYLKPFFPFRLFFLVCFTIVVYLPMLGQKNKNKLPAFIPESSDTWFIQRDSVYAYEVETPVKLKEEPAILKKTTIPAGWQVKTYASTDRNTGIYYMLSITEPLYDLYIFDDSLYMESLRENQVNNLEYRTQDTILKRQGFFCYLQTGKTPKAKGDIFIKTMATVRYNRIITVGVGFFKSNENHPDITKFMGSFRMLPTQRSPFTNFSFANGSFSTDVPAPFLFHIDTVNSEQPLITYNSRDTMTSEVYTTVVTKAADKQWYRNAWEYWEEKMAILTDENDSLINQFQISNGEAEGYQVLLESYRLHKHIRMLPFADSLLLLVYVLPRNEVPDERHKRFFESFRFNGTYQKPNLFQSGAATLLADLSSTDTSIFNSALTRMDDAPFSVADIPVLRKALLQHYPLATYSTTEILTPTEKISRALLSLADPSISSFAMNNYFPENGRNPLEQSLILDLVARDAKEETYAFISKQLKAFAIDASVAQDVFYALTDDTDMLSEVFADMLPLIKNPNMLDGMLSVINTLLVTDSIKAAPLLPYEERLMNELENGLKTPGADTSGSFYNRMFRLISIAGHLQTQRAKSLLHNCTHSFGMDLQLEAGIQLATMNEKTNPDLWEKLAANREMRYKTYHRLHEAGKVALFPAGYLYQQKMAESLLWQYGLDEANPVSIKEVTTRKTTLKDNRVTVYFFAMGFTLDDGKVGQRLGMAVFPEDKSILKVVDGWYEFDWETPYESRQKEKLISEMMKWLEE